MARAWRCPGSLRACGPPGAVASGRRCGVNAAEQGGDESGRVARAMAVESMDEHRRKRREEEKAREILAAKA